MRRSRAMVPFRLMLAAVCSITSGAMARGDDASGPGLGRADFRYAPPWWQSAICLPDDPDKILVGKEGQILLDFGHGKVRNFGIVLQDTVHPGATWVKQQTISARVPIVQTFKTALGVDVLEEAFVIVPGTEGAAGSKAPTKGDSLPDRRAVILVTLHNGRDAPVERSIGMHIDSSEILRTDANAAIAVGARTWIRSSEPGQVTLTLGPGESRQVAWTIDRASTPPQHHLSVSEAREALSAVQQWWDHADLPFATIQVPDPDIQGMFEASVRNIWQAREIKGGLPAFHVGPTVYRGLWVVDGSFLLEAAAILGRGQDARAGVEYLLGHQKPDGSFEILPHFWKENGIVLWAATRHARLTQDKDWLRARWPRLQAVVRAIEALRAGRRPMPMRSSSGSCRRVKSTAGSATPPNPNTRTPTGAWLV